MSKKPETADGTPEIDLGEVYSRTEILLDKYKTQLTYGAIGLVAVVGIVLGYRKLYAEPRAREASELMWKAEYYFEVDSLDLAENGDDQWPGFAEIADNYGGTPAGKLAHFYLGSIAMQRGDHEAAIAHYGKAKVKDEVLRAMAEGATGDALVELDRRDEAVKHFERAASLTTNELTTPMFLMKAGILHHQAGNWKAARKVFSRIVKEFPKSADVDQARKFAGFAEAQGG